MGHTVEFKKGVPNGDVPRALYEEIMEKGILPCDEKGKVIDIDSKEAADIMPEPVKIILRPKDAFEASDKILEVMKAIIENNDPNNFTGAGMPSAKVISSKLGWVVDTKEVRALWTKHIAELKAE